MTSSSISSAAVADIEKSIVYIKITWSGVFQMPKDDGTTGWTKVAKASFRCTGFIVGTAGEIVTAGHCVDPTRVQVKRALAADLVRNYIAEENQETVFDVLMKYGAFANESSAPLQDGRVVEVTQPDAVVGAVITKDTIAQVDDFRSSGDGDLALLRVPNLPVETPALKVASKSSVQGDDVTAIGFPGSVSDLVNPNQLRASFKQGSVSSIQSTNNGVPVTEIDAAVSPGMSGGPTVNEAGEVIGVNSFKNADESQAFNFITDTGALRNWLASHNVQLPVTPAPAAPDQSLSNTASQSSDSGFPTYWVVGGVLVLAVVVVGGFMLTKKRTKGSMDSNQFAHPSTYPSGPPPGLQPYGEYPPSGGWQGSPPPTRPIEDGYNYPPPSNPPS